MPDTKSISANFTLELLKRVCSSKELLENATDLTDLLSQLRPNENDDPVTPFNAFSNFDRPTPTKVWGVGLLFVTIISCCAAAGIALMPMLNRRTYRRLLIYFIGLGVGSLSGSAVFHLLPQAWGLVDDTGKGSHAYLGQAWMTVFGIYMFFLVDKVLKIILEFRKRLRSKVDFDIQRDRNQDPDSELETPITLMSVTNQHGHIPDRQGETSRTQQCQCDGPCSMDSMDKVGTETVDVLREIQHMCSHDHEVHFEKGKSVIATVAWMIIFGDGLHNFIDGLSIGAAFTDSILSGISVSVAVLCEEFPHELGDVAILVSAGMTLRQALLYNLLSAATCYLGFILGVVVGEFAAATSFIFALAGGMFLYISLGSMAPEMNTMLEKSLNVSIGQGFLVLLLQSLGVFTGLIIMFVMSRFGPEIQFG